WCCGPSVGAPTLLFARGGGGFRLGVCARRTRSSISSTSSLACASFGASRARSTTSDRNWGPDKRIPAGMGIVVPGERILEVVMNDPELKKHRAEIHQKRRAERDM